jgi:hypothetical protein
VLIKPRTLDLSSVFCVLRFENVDGILADLEFLLINLMWLNVVFYSFDAGLDMNIRKMTAGGNEYNDETDLKRVFF